MVAKIGEQRLLDIAMDACSPFANKVLITGGHVELVAALCDQRTDSNSWTTLHNPNHATGMSSSIQIAVMEAKRRNCDGILITLGDLCRVTSLDLMRLTKAFLENPAKAVAAEFKESFGPPCIFPAQQFDEILSLKGPLGAKSLLKFARKISLPNAAHDMDTVADRKRLSLITQNA